MAVGVPLPVIPGYVGRTLGFGPIVVGGIVGLQSLVTLMTRQVAGRMCDTSGPKRVSLLGLICACGAGGCYAGSVALAAHPAWALGAMAFGRVILGLGESLFITALAAWGIARVGPAHSGRVMAWSGISMYAAVAIGAPLGTALPGFGTVAACAVLLPAVGAVLTMALRDEPPRRSAPASFMGVLHAIWMPGVAMALASSGVGMITAFLALRYHGAGWPNAGLALAGFGAGYIVMRVLFGGLPDRLGGYRVALLSLAGEAASQLILWLAPSPWVAFAGACLTGLSYSLIFPALGVEAMKRVRGENRGEVLGAYLASFDLGLAAAGPVAGVVMAVSNVPAIFLFAAVAAVAAFALTLAARANPPRL